MNFTIAWNRKVKSLIFISVGYLAFLSCGSRIYTNNRENMTVFANGSSSVSEKCIVSGSDYLDAIPYPKLEKDINFIQIDAKLRDFPVAVKNDKTKSNGDYIKKEIFFNGTPAIYKEGKIASNFYQSASKADIPYKVVNNFISALRLKVNFKNAVHSGDTFSVVYTKSGEVLYAQIKTKKREYKVYKHNDGTRDGYYTEHGDNVNMKDQYFAKPIANAKVSSHYGMRFHPVLRTKKMHSGVDYFANFGTSVKAIGDGTVCEVAFDCGYGRYVVIKHDNGYKSKYAHLSRFCVAVGNKVRAGTEIGKSGASGNVTGAHLHFELEKNGIKVNPSCAVKVNSVKLCGAKLDKFKKDINKLHREINKNKFL